MTMQEHAREYDFAAGLLNAQIRRTEQALAELTSQERLRQLRMELRCLQEIRREAQQTAHYLKHYYDRQPRKGGTRL